MGTHTGWVFINCSHDDLLSGFCEYWNLDNAFWFDLTILLPLWSREVQALTILGKFRLPYKCSLHQGITLHINLAFWLTLLTFLTISLFFFFFGHACGMQKFLGQGWNMRHSRDLSHRNDNTRSLTARPLGTPSLSLFLNSVLLILNDITLALCLVNSYCPIKAQIEYTHFAMTSPSPIQTKSFLSIFLGEVSVMMANT